MQATITWSYYTSSEKTDIGRMLEWLSLHDWQSIAAIADVLGEWSEADAALAMHMLAGYGLVEQDYDTLRWRAR